MINLYSSILFKQKIRFEEPFHTKCMSLEDIVLCQENQSQRTDIILLNLYELVQGWLMCRQKVDSRLTRVENGRIKDDTWRI
jgi:hypothetical protein